MLLIKAYNRAREKKPYLVCIGTSFLQSFQNSSSVKSPLLKSGDSGILTWSSLPSLPSSKVDVSLNVLESSFSSSDNRSGATTAG